MLKIIGLSSLVLSGVLFSCKMQDDYKKRIEELEAFLESIQLLKTEMLYLKTPICEIFEKIADENGGVIRQFFRFVTEGMKEGTPLRALWQEGLSKYELLFHLKQKELQILSDFSVLLGQTDLQNQLENIENTMERLRIQLRNVQTEKAKKVKPQGTLYIAGVLAIGILLL